MAPNSKLVQLLKNRNSAWKNTLAFNRPSTSCSAFLNNMHHWCSEGRRDRARSCIKELFVELFPNESWPKNKTWRQIGTRIGYQLQMIDWTLLGKKAQGRVLQAYKNAMMYRVDPNDPMAVADGWQLDGEASSTVARTRLASEKKGKGAGGSLKGQINDLIDQLGRGEAELECGAGSKGHTTMKGGAGKVHVSAKKGACTYDLSKEYDRNVLFNRIQRWARKEDIFGE